MWAIFILKYISPLNTDVFTTINTCNHIKSKILYWLAQHLTCSFFLYYYWGEHKKKSDLHEDHQIKTKTDSYQLKGFLHELLKTHLTFWFGSFSFKYNRSIVNFSLLLHCYRLTSLMRFIVLIHDCTKVIKWESTILEKGLFPLKHIPLLRFWKNKLLLLVTSFSSIKKNCLKPMCQRCFSDHSQLQVFLFDADALQWDVLYHFLWLWLCSVEYFVLLDY